ncbi:MAG: retroviral-like aspartic protease family protein [Candidatus Omnitrophica bacterium]|nr:retroviral-like aspartic protease family protein [Candidatus Omnitrophota bacterium]
MYTVYIGIIIILIFGSLDGSAETIILKNGKIVVGEITEETEDAVVVTKLNGEFVYTLSREQIKEVRKSTAQESKADQERELSAHRAYNKTKRDRARRLKAYRSERAEKERVSAKRARGIEKIKFVGNKFGVVDVVINGKVKTALALDTGSAVVVISRGIAEKLGSSGKEAKRKIEVILADGSRAEATPILLESLAVGQAKVNNVKAAIIDNAQAGSDTEGLLGMSFLSHFRVKLNAKENYLVLEE